MDFEKITIRAKISSRGGGVEIDLTSEGFEGVKMTAYQNYLGGGMLGKINSDCNKPDWESNGKLVSISDNLKKYFHTLTNPDGEWESSSFEVNQNRPTSTY